MTSAYALIAFGTLGLAVFFVAASRFADMRRTNDALNDRGDGTDGDAGMDFDSTHGEPTK